MKKLNLISLRKFAINAQTSIPFSMLKKFIFINHTQINLFDHLFYLIKQPATVTQTVKCKRAFVYVISVWRIFYSFFLYNTFIAYTLHRLLNRNEFTFLSISASIKMFMFSWLRACVTIRTMFHHIIFCCVLVTSCS